MLGAILCLGAPIKPAAGSQEAATSPPKTEDRAERLVRCLRTDQSPQVRLEAVQSLAKLAPGVLAAIDRELVVPPLIQTMMEDHSEAVRAACAQALGQLGDSAARGSLKAACSDPSPQVRLQAEAALKRLEHGPAQQQSQPGAAKGAAAAGEAVKRRIKLTLGRTASKARGLTPDLPRRLREAIVRELRDNPDVLLVEEEKSPGQGFSVESSVTELSRRTTAAGEMEVTCEVSMVIGLLPTRTIVGMTSGGATIQAPRRMSRRPPKGMAQALEEDALSHAVRGANQNLLAFLRNQK